MLKIGIFGGTFSPPHSGHIAAVEAFLAEENLDKLYIIPAFQPPHKEITYPTTPKERYTMAKLAFSHLPKVVVSDMEILRGGKSYTVDTLEQLFSEEHRLVLLCGTDMFLSLDTWYQHERIFDLADIVYVERYRETPNEELHQKTAYYTRTYQARIRKLTIPPFPVTSTEIREALKTKKALPANILPRNVVDYIKEKGLYSI